MSLASLEPILVIPGITDAPTLACIARSRKYSQYVKAVDDAVAGRCAFCNPDPNHNKIIAVPSAELLRVWHCNPPEKHTKFHFLICPCRHVKSTLELTSYEWAEVRSILHDLAAEFDIPYRGILIRDGDATQSAGTVQHLHMHVMVPDGTGRVESPFCKTPDEERAGVVRAIIYEKMRTGTPFAELPPDEQELIKDRI